VLCRWSGGSTRAWSGLDGVFELEDDPSGVVELSAWPDEYERAIGRPDTAPMRIEVVPGEVAHVELDLALELGTIAGRVTTAMGEPRRHMSVLASARGANWRAVTGADGHFELQVPADAGTYQVHVEGAAPIRTGVNAAELAITSSRPGRLRLRVVDSVTGAVVDRTTLFVRPLGGTWDWKGAYSVDPAGLVEFVLRPGQLDLAVNKVDDGYPPMFVGGLLLIEGEELEVAVELAQVGPVEFRLIDPPLPRPCGIRVEGTSADPTFALRDFGDGGPAMRLQFADGVAVVRGLPGGRYRLVPSQEAIRLEPSEIEIGDDRSEPIEIRWQQVEAR